MTADLVLTAQQDRALLQLLALESRGRRAQLAQITAEDIGFLSAHVAYNLRRRGLVEIYRTDTTARYARLTGTARAWAVAEEAGRAAERAAFACSHAGADRCIVCATDAERLAAIGAAQEVIHAPGEVPPSNT